MIQQPHIAGYINGCNDISWWALLTQRTKNISPSLLERIEVRKKTLSLQLRSVKL